MKTVLFDENNPKSRQELIAALFQDEQDPRSSSYRRVLHRPKLRWGAIAAFFALWIALLAALALALSAVHAGAGRIVPALLLATLVYIAVFAKSILITAVRLYQRFAPDALRNKCRFEPSCSEYMILAVQKYGLLKGARKGVDRLKRCNVEHGGYDLP